MTLDVVRGTNKKPVASSALIDTFKHLGELEGQLFVGFPLLSGQSETQAVDALLLSPTLGAVVFDLVEGGQVGDVEGRHDELARLVQARLLHHKELFRRRELMVNLTVVTFVPTRHEVDGADEEYPVADPEHLGETLANLELEKENGARYEFLLSAIQNISRLRKSRAPRKTTTENSRGARLQALEASIATLDRMQSKAVIETIDGVQRIRGLAGSGKTIILALKAAYLHAQHPDWHIAVTYNTRSLHEQFVRLITNFSIEQSSDEPDWDRLHVLNAWGGRGAIHTGLYADFCRTNGVPFRDFQSASAAFGRRRAFDGACTEALGAVSNGDPQYDVILVDEAQDFPPSFLRLCYSMLTEQKRLVYAYDELQSLDGTGLPSAEDIFGSDTAGNPHVTLSESTYDQGARRDIVLEKCYRNSRPVLVTAHALGFGIYRRPTTADATGLVQMFDQPKLWNEIGYELVEGELAPGRRAVLARDEDSSPGFLESHSPVEDLVQFHTFASQEEQDEWVANSIRANLVQEELRHDDIVVINPDAVTARRNLAPLRKLLLERGIANHLAGVDTSADVFFDRGADSVTFTGIYRAKGNEAGMVYVVNAHEGVSSATNLALNRNRLFTAMTRSKAWVRVLGVGDDMTRLTAEYEAAAAADFKLGFVYPTDEERAALRIVHREVSKKQEQRIARGRGRAQELLDDLQEGVLPQDIDPETRAQLLRYLQGDGNA